MAPWNLNRHQRGPNTRISHQDSTTTITPSQEISSPGSGLDGPAVIPPALHDVDEANSTDYDSSPSRYRPPFHVRSLSNPFPSLFRGKRRKDTRSDSPTEIFSNSDLPCDDFYPPWCSEATGVNEDKGQAKMKDFASGNCMTCGSTMRWPKELDVFKCSICVTINDLTPLGAKKVHERRPHGQSGLAPKILSTDCPLLITLL